ncbi:15729_t:CDS:2, partial [Entrophospora sp. SA101]
SISEEEKKFKHQLKREHIFLYDYNSFQNIEFIDNGSFGTISLGFSKHHQELVALKSINIDQKYTFEQFLNEAKQHRKVEFHSNILSFYGITKENKSIKFTDLVLIMTSDEREAIIKGTPRKYAEIYTDLRPCIDQVVQDLDNVDITNTVEDIVNLTNQTNNELQNDDLLYSTELSISIISMN